jgi:iron(III) transport system permease protein
MLRRILVTLVILSHAAIVAALLVVPLRALWGSLAELTFDADMVGRWLVLLGNSAVVTFSCLLMAFAISAPAALLLAKSDVPMRGGLLVGIALLACVPGYVQTTLLLNVIPLWWLGTSPIVCGMLQGVLLCPLAILLLYALFRSSSAELEEAALLDTTPLHVLRSITLMQHADGLVGVAIVLMVLSITSFAITDLFRVRTFSEEVYTLYAQGKYGLAAISGFPLWVLLLVCFGWLGRNLSRWAGWAIDVPTGEPRRFRLPGSRGVWAAALWLVLLGPFVGLLVILAAKLSPLDTIPTTIWSLRGELTVSLTTAVAAATVMTMSCVGIAASLRRFGWLAVLVWLVMAMLMALPAPTAGLTLIKLMNRDGLAGMIYDSSAMLVVGYVVRFAPYALLLAMPGVMRVSADLLSAARIDGCDWLALQRHVYWPELRLQMLFVWFVLCYFCMDEIACSVLIAAPGATTLSIRAFTLLHFGVYRDLAVLTVITLGCSLIAWGGLCLCAYQLWWRRDAIINRG